MPSKMPIPGVSAWGWLEDDGRLAHFADYPLEAIEILADNTEFGILGGIPIRVRIVPETELRALVGELERLRASVAHSAT